MDVRDEISIAQIDQNKLINVDSGTILSPSPLSQYNPFDDLPKKHGKKVKNPRFNPFDELAKKKALKSLKQDKATKSVDVVDQFVNVSSIIANTLSDLANDNLGKVDENEQLVKDKANLGKVDETEKEQLVNETEKENESEKQENESDKDKAKVKGSNVLHLQDKESEKEKKSEKLKEIEKESEKEKKKEKESEKAGKKLKVKFKVNNPKSSEKSPKATPKSTKKLKLNVEKDSDLKKISKSKADENKKSKRKRVDSSVCDKEEYKGKKKVKDDSDDDEKKLSKRKRDDSSGSAEDVMGKKKLKGKAQMKMKEDDTPEVDISDGVMKQLLKNMLKNASVKELVKEEFEENQVKGKKKEKKLTDDDIRRQEYLSKLPILHAKTAPTALHVAIHGIKHINLEKFLSEIGFSSFFKFGIDYIPSRLGRYVVKNFDGRTCRLNLEDGKWIEATVSKVHDLFGIPIGGVPLLSLEMRPAGDDFEAVWKRQFDKIFKKVRVNDIALKLIASKEVDFLFKINFLTLFTNTMGMCASQGEINLDVVRHVREDDITRIDWCEYIFHCLKSSKAPSTEQSKYTGPYTLLALLYLDSTKYKKLPVVRTRPAIKQWTSFLMAQRQDMELKDICFGESDLYGESELPETEGFVAGGSSESSFKEELLSSLEEKLSVISKERACIEELLAKAGLDFRGDSKLIDLHKKYVEMFKHPVELNVENLDADDESVDDHNGNDKQLAGTNP